MNHASIIADVLLNTRAFSTYITGNARVNLADILRGDQLTPEVLHTFASSADASTATAIAQNTSTGADTLQLLSSHRDSTTREHVARHRNTSVDTLALLAHDSNGNVRIAARESLITVHHAHPLDFSATTVKERIQQIHAICHPDYLDRWLTPATSGQLLTILAALSPNQRPSLSSDPIRTLIKCLYRINDWAALTRLCSLYYPSSIGHHLAGLPAAYTASLHTAVQQSDTDTLLALASYYRHGPSAVMNDWSQLTAIPPRLIERLPAEYINTAAVKISAEDITPTLTSPFRGMLEHGNILRTRMAPGSSVRVLYGVAAWMRQASVDDAVNAVDRYLDSVSDDWHAKSNVGYFTNLALVTPDSHLDAVCARALARRIQPPGHPLLLPVLHEYHTRSMPTNGLLSGTGWADIADGYDTLRSRCTRYNNTADRAIFTQLREWLTPQFAALTEAELAIAGHVVTDAAPTATVAELLTLIRSLNRTSDRTIHVPSPPSAAICGQHRR